MQRKKRKEKVQMVKERNSGRGKQTEEDSEESPKQQNWRGERKVGDRAHEVREMGEAVTERKKNDSSDNQTACDRKKQPAGDFCFLQT